MATDYDELRKQRMAALDEETRAGFELAAQIPSLRDLGVDAFRDLFGQVVGGNGELAPGVTAETVSIPGPGGAIRTRVYRPEGDGPHGVYLHTHAGGWIAGGGVTTWDAYNSMVAVEWGCAVVHPDFRLPPEHRFPAAVEDCWAAAQWIDEQGPDQGLDRERIAVGGGCTGANLAATIALMARDAGSPPIALQLLESPQFDTRCDYRSHFECATGYGLSRSDDTFVVEQYLSDPEDRWDWRASPILVDSVRGLAPAIVTVGEYEILRDEARLYAGRLRDAGIAVHYIEGPGQGHGFTGARNPETKAYTKAAAAARAQVTPLMRRFIGPRT